MRGPKRYVEWINSHIGFNPRGQANSDAMSGYIQDDLIQASPKIAELVRAGMIVPKKNFNVKANFAIRNVDFVFQRGDKLPEIYVPLSVENKTIMTAHGKARKNRYGDIIAYCNHVHNHRRECIRDFLETRPTSPLVFIAAKKFSSRHLSVADALGMLYVKIYTPLRSSAENLCDLCG